MSYTARLNPKAETEYQEAFIWYEERSKGLGLRFETGVDKTINSLVKNPEWYPITDNDCRQAKVPGFPFQIVYKMFPELKVILIISIFHMSRYPGDKLW